MVQPEGLGSLSSTVARGWGAVHTAVASISVHPPPPCHRISGSLACEGCLEPQHLAQCFNGWWSALELSGPSLSPPWSVPRGPVPSDPNGGRDAAAWGGVGEG